MTESEVFDFLKAYEAAANGRDFSEVAEMIHPNAIYRFNDGDFVGRDAIRGAFEQTWAYDVADERYWLEDIRIVYLDASSACLTYNYHWSGTGRNGPFHDRGRGTQLIVRDGALLRSMYEHLST